MRGKILQFQSAHSNKFDILEGSLLDGIYALTVIAQPLILLHRAITIPLSMNPIETPCRHPRIVLTSPKQVKSGRTPLFIVRAPFLFSVSFLRCIQFSVISAIGRVEALCIDLYLFKRTALPIFLSCTTISNRAAPIISLQINIKVCSWKIVVTFEDNGSMKIG